MPNRILKESIRTSKKVNALSDFDYRVWSYLITYVDDYGRGSADPELLKGLVFPRRKSITEAQIQKAIDNLATAGMVILYRVDGESYLYFPNWSKHQTIRAKKSRFPEPAETCMQMHADASECSRNPIQSNTIQSVSESVSECVCESADAQHTQAKHKYGEFEWVKLTDAEYERLLKDMGQEELDRCIQYVDESAQKTGNKNKWKDWNLVVRQCNREGWGMKQERRDSYGLSGNAATGNQGNGSRWNVKSRKLD